MGATWASNQAFSVATNLSINGNTMSGQEGALGNAGNAQPTQLLTLPQIPATDKGNTNTSGWFELNSREGVLAEIFSSSYLGTVLFQGTNDGVNIQNLYMDNAPTDAQSWYVPVFMGPGAYRFVRFVAVTGASNAGTLNCQIRVFGQEVDRSLGGTPNGVRNVGNLELVSGTNLTSVGPVDFQAPAGCMGFNVWTDLSTFTGGTSLTPKVAAKDPISGAYAASGANVFLAAAAMTGTGDSILSVGTGLPVTTNVSINALPSTHWGYYGTVSGTFSALVYTATVLFVL